MAGQPQLLIFYTIIHTKKLKSNNKYSPGARLAKGGKIRDIKQGFSLIELMVAMFIFMIVTIAMVSVSLAGFRSYIKSKAIKTVTEDVGFAINSIAKDVRMGKIRPTPVACSANNCLVLIRNIDQKMICYKIESGNKILRLYEGANIDCTSGTATKDIVSLDSTMSFSTNSRFYSAVTDATHRGWVEINLNIANSSMETDSINVQTVVSSRDYGWESE